MPRVKLAVGGWFGASCAIAAALLACSGKENDLFSDPSRGGQTSTGGSGTAGDGISGATSGNGGTPSGGTSGSSTGGVATGGMPQSGGTVGEGGAAAESGTDSGGTGTGGTGGTGLTSGAGGAGTSGSGGASAAGGVGMGGAGAGGAGTAGAGNGGTGGRPPGTCSDEDDCDDADYCKKSSCDAAMGSCVPVGPICVGDDAVFEPVCGCDGITYYNTCTIEHDGINVASMGECTGNNRPTCTRDNGGYDCPPREHARCYRPVEMCGDPSPVEGVCWVLPTECPENEPVSERYCGGTAGSARCIALCEVIDAENSFRRNSPTCD
jgi:hypothetical protein